MNPLRATPIDTCDMIDFVKEEVFALIEVTAATLGLIPGNAAGEDDTRPERLKALNGGGVRWLTRA